MLAVFGGMSARKEWPKECKVNEYFQIYPTTRTWLFSVPLRGIMALLHSLSDLITNAQESLDKVRNSASSSCECCSALYAIILAACVLERSAEDERISTRSSSSADMSVTFCPGCDLQQVLSMFALKFMKNLPKCGQNVNHDSVLSLQSFYTII